jgi:glutathione S-transferase
MLKLYAAPRTRAFRVVWLLEELGLPYELEMVEFQPTSSKFFIQNTPTGKIPTLEDDDVVMCESGAIVEYILEKYAADRLTPALGTKTRAAYLQWLHFADSTAFAPLGVIVWLTLYRQDAADHPELVADAISRAQTPLQFLEDNLAGDGYLLGNEFSAADIMMGFTLMAARMLNQLDERPKLAAYFARLEEREAFQAALAQLS